ncbi:MAG: ABC transporter ATP-binding protein [Planctomycetota bacterium]
MSGFRRYVALLAPYRTRYLVGLGLLLLTNALSLLVPWLVKGAVDVLAARRGARAAPAGLLSEPWHYVLGLALVGVILALARTTSRVVLLGAGRFVARDLRERLYARLLRADPSFYMRFGTGELMSRCVSDVGMMQGVASPGVLWSFNALFMFAIALPPMLAVSPSLTGLVLLPYPFLAAVTMWAATRVRGFAKEAQAAMAELTTNLQETLEGMEVVKAFTLEDQQARRFEQANDRYLERSMKEALTSGWIGIVSVFTAGFGTCVILWAGGRQVAEGALSYGDLALFVSLNAMVLRPTIFLGWVLSLGQRGLASLDRLEELLHAPLAVVAPEGPVARGPLRGEVEARGLTYRYPLVQDQGPDLGRAAQGKAAPAAAPAGEDAAAAPQAEAPAQRRLALEEVSFRVPAGGVLGFTGRIGSGKSTALRAIPRFVDTPRGSVLVDGVPVEDWDLGELRGGIGYVPQDGMVFSMSLRENVAFGRPEASEDEVRAAADAAELSKDLDQLEQGLDTLVGERGVTLSGGQRQRLAIARAVLVAPRLLLLDDALSMVDAETAVAVLENLRRTLPGATVIAAAHRTATLLGADEVLVFDRGRVVERGKPADLLGHPGSRFRAMHERQRLQSEILEGA